MNLGTDTSSCTSFSLCFLVMKKEMIDFNINDMVKSNLDEPPKLVNKEEEFRKQLQRSECK